MMRARNAGLVVAGCIALGVVGCRSSVAPTAGTPFPSFALMDVNPQSASTGRTVMEDRLSGPAAVVYFGHAT